MNCQSVFDLDFKNTHVTFNILTPVYLSVTYEGIQDVQFSQTKNLQKH